MTGVFACFVGPLASGETVYDNGGPQNSFSPGGYEMTGWIEADDFAFSEQTRLDGIKFWTLEAPGAFSGSVYWRIYRNTADDHPGAIVAEGLVMPAHQPGREVAPPFAEWVNTFSIPSVTLPPGTYWLGLHHGPLSNNIVNPSALVFWESSSQSSSRMAQQNTGPNFDDSDWETVFVPGSPTPPHLAFQLSGVVYPRATGIAKNGGTPQFSFSTRSGYTYRVEYKNNIADRDWNTLAGAEMVNGTGGVIQVSDPNAFGVPRRFYRAVVL